MGSLSVSLRVEVLLLKIYRQFWLLAAAMSQERERMKELTDRYGGEIPCNPIGDKF